MRNNKSNKKSIIYNKDISLTLIRLINFQRYPVSNKNKGITVMDLFNKIKYTPTLLVTKNRIRKAPMTSYPTLNRHIGKLYESGFLEQSDGNEKNRKFYAVKISKLFEEFLLFSKQHYEEELLQINKKFSNNPNLPITSEYKQRMEKIISFLNYISPPNIKDLSMKKSLLLFFDNIVRAMALQYQNKPIGDPLSKVFEYILDYSYIPSFYDNLSLKLDFDESLCLSNKKDLAELKQFCYSFPYSSWQNGAYIKVVFEDLVLSSYVR